MKKFKGFKILGFNSIYYFFYAPVIWNPPPPLLGIPGAFTFTVSRDVGVGGPRGPVPPHFFGGNATRGPYSCYPTACNRGAPSLLNSLLRVCCQCRTVKSSESPALRGRISEWTPLPSKHQARFVHQAWNPCQTPAQPLYCIAKPGKTTWQSKSSKNEVKIPGSSPIGEGGRG